ncbi:hypothetical protein [Palaeococcus ferrophilus]|uniref:hypothetical protein n=1 Tax=Palaeococcus ferrophilus TaxID=83868 RepID=UPI00064F709D|nr:hypothetical protein [Palaeococcus ferrophilus]
MEDVKELKDVLERVEGKLIAAGKMYGAMNFGAWLSVMLFYYLLMGLFNVSWKFSLIYWPIAFVVATSFTARVWMRVKRIGKVTGKELETSRTGAVLVALSWTAGIVIGWIVVPKMNLGVTSDASIAVGFLTFITLSIFGMWLVFAKYGGAEREMLPAFLLPAMGIPFARGMESGALLWASFLVALGFSITILWYIYSAFRAIER